VHPQEALVSCDGSVFRAQFSPSLHYGDIHNAIAVGDEVMLRSLGPGHIRVEEVLPRRSALTRGAGDASREDALQHVQVLAANIDQVIVVCSAAEPPFRPRLIDRYLVAASRDTLPAILCVNKRDLGVSADTRTYLNGYEALGVEVLLTSANTGEGIPELRDAVGGRTTLLAGHSGVGKSSVLNALEPDLALRVGSVTQATAGQGKGRHTTSSAKLIPLSTPGTFVVDSPGIRAFGVSGIAARQLADHFPDLAQFASSCRFSDCLHNGEDGCGVPEAAATAPFLNVRWESYRILLEELR
jgi:ribosome biogenesis GTPase